MYRAVRSENDGVNYKSKVVCTDDRWQSTTLHRSSASSACGGSWEGFVDVKDGNLLLESNGDAGSSAKYLVNLKNKDIKTVVKLTVNSQPSSADSGGFVIELNGQEITRKSIPLTFSKFAQSRSEDYLIEILKDFNDPNIFHVLVNGVETKTVGIHSDTAYLTYTTTASGMCGGKTSNSVLSVSFLKSRAYFNCNVDTDEVVIKDTFSEKSEFSIKDLTYIPVKFCVDSYPAVKRSFTEKGVRADIQGQTTKILVTGETLKVNTNESLEIYYIADYIENMGERCGLDSAYDTKLKKCVKIISEEEDVIQIINTKEFISVGNKDVQFDDKISLAGKDMISSQPLYSCVDEETTTLSPRPRESCWSIPISFDGKSSVLEYGKLTKLNEYISIRGYTNTKVSNEVIQPGFKNNFILTFSDKLLSINPVSEDSSKYYIMFKDKRNLKFSLTNNFETFSTENSGVQVKITRNLLTSQKTEQIKLSIKKGTNEYSIPIETGEYGKITYEIVPFYKINGQVIFDDEKLVKNYEIVSKIPENVSLISAPVVDTKISNNLNTKSYFPYILGGLVALLLGYFIYKKKK